MIFCLSGSKHYMRFHAKVIGWLACGPLVFDAMGRYFHVGASKQIQHINHINRTGTTKVQSFLLFHCDEEHPVNE